MCRWLKPDNGNKQWLPSEWNWMKRRSEKNKKRRRGGGRRSWWTRKGKGKRAELDATWANEHRRRSRCASLVNNSLNNSRQFKIRKTEARERERCESIHQRDVQLSRIRPALESAGQWHRRGNLRDVFGFLAVLLEIGEVTFAVAARLDQSHPLLFVVRTCRQWFNHQARSFVWLQIASQIR